jgi:hypothetical protein
MSRYVVNICVLAGMFAGIMSFNLYANHVHNDSMVAHSWALAQSIVAAMLYALRNEGGN